MFRLPRGGFLWSYNLMQDSVRSEFQHPSVSFSPSIYFFLKHKLLHTQTHTTQTGLPRCWNLFGQCYLWSASGPSALLSVSLYSHCITTVFDVGRGRATTGEQQWRSRLLSHYFIYFQLVPLNAVWVKNRSNNLCVLLKVQSNLTPQPCRV